MATYFTSRAPSRQSRKSAATSLAECSIGDADEDAGARLAALAPKNEEAKAALLARHAADAYKWLLPLRSARWAPSPPSRFAAICCLPVCLLLTSA